MKRSEKALAILLAALTPSLLLASCSNGGSENADPTEAALSADGEPVTAEEEAEPDPFDSVTVKNFDGADFNYLTYQTTASADWNDFNVDELSGEVLSDAIYNRNLRVSDAMNLKFTYSVGGTGDVNGAITAGDDIYRFVCLNLSDAFGMNSSGKYYNLLKLEPFSFDNPYWDARTVEEMTICGHLGFVTGDLLVRDDLYSWAYLFNQDMIRDFQLESPYDAVKSGGWTFDVMTEMAEAVASDSNGDGAMDQHDTWGLICENYGYYLTVMGSGCKSVGKDSDGRLILTIEDENMYAAFEAVQRLYGNKNVSFLAEDWSSIASSNVWVEYVFPMYMNNQGLFHMGHLATACSTYRDMESAYGIVPTPKLTAEQDGYYCSGTAYGISTVSIPISCNTPDDSALVLEALSAASVTGVTPAYHDAVLVNKGLRDEVSVEMLDIIMKSKTFDIGFISIGTISSTVTGFINGGEYASSIAKITKAANKSLDVLNDTFSGE